MTRKFLTPIVLPADPAAAMEAATKQYVDAIPTKTAWTALPLGAGWANYGSGWQVAQYRKNGDVVEVRGLVANSTGNSNPIGTLPAGFRPPAPQMFNGHTVVGATSGNARLDAQTGGNIDGTYYPIAGAVAYLSLAQIRFSIT